MGDSDTFFDDAKCRPSDGARRQDVDPCAMSEPLLKTFTGFPGRRTCMLVITHACNLNCTYCYEAHKGDRYMSFSVAVECLKKEIALIRGNSAFKELEVQFMGGEPFMAFPMIKDIVNWMKCNAGGIPWICSCSTNGTLVTEEKKKWLEENRKSFVPCLSYDGDEEMQRRNRGSERGSIDVDFFLRVWPFQHLHMTVSKETLPNLFSGIVDIQQRGGQVDLALAQGVEWNDEDARVFDEQLQKLSLFYLDNPKSQPVNILSRMLFGIPGDASKQTKFCGTGTHMVAYDVDGKPYGCHMFTSVVMGDEVAKKQVAAIDWKNGCSFSDPYCADCVYKAWCPTCCGFNLRLRGNLATRDHGWCSMIRVQVRRACEFQLKYFGKYKDRLTGADIQQLEGVLQTYEAIKPEGVRDEHDRN